MSTEFRPKEFRVFRALGLGLSAWARNFIPLTLLAAVLFSPVIIWISQIEPGDAATFDELVRNYFYIPIGAVIGLSALLTPLVTYRIVKHLGGSSVSILTSMRYGVRGFVPALILAAILFGLAFVGAIGGWITMIVLAHLFVASPAAVTERLGPFAAFSRSLTLTSGRRWGIFGLCFLIQIILAIVLKGYVQPMLEDDSARDPFGTLSKAAYILAGLMAVYCTFLGIVQAVSYGLLRQEKDGVSHEELARVFE
jgi:hypothetical protein